MCSKSAQKAVKCKAKLSNKVIASIKEAMSLGSEYGLDIPANVQAVATTLIKGSS